MKFESSPWIVQGGGGVETEDGFALFFSPGLLTGSTSTIKIYGPTVLPASVTLGGLTPRSASLGWVVESSAGVTTAHTGPEVRIPYDPANQPSGSNIYVAFAGRLLQSSWTRANNDTNDDPDSRLTRRMATIPIATASSTFVFAVGVYGD